MVRDKTLVAFRDLLFVLSNNPSVPFSFADHIILQYNIGPLSNCTIRYCFVPYQGSTTSLFFAQKAYCDDHS